MSTTGFTVLQAGILAANTFNEARAAKAQADHQRRIARFNRDLASFQAEDAVRMGEKEAQRHLLRSSLLRKTAKAGFATQNVVVGEGTPLEIQQQIASAGLEDAVTIQNNAFARAFGFRQEAINQQAAGRFAKIAGRQRVSRTIATGGVQIASEISRGIVASRRVPSSNGDA